MLSVPASSCRLVGTVGMLFLFTLAIPVQAAERRGLGRAGTIYVLIMRLCRKIEINPHWCFASPIQRLASFWSNLS